MRWAVARYTVAFVVRPLATDAQIAAFRKRHRLAQIEVFDEL